MLKIADMLHDPEKEIVIDYTRIYKTTLYLNSMKHDILILNFVLACLLASVPALADPTPFRAIYKADYKGLPVTAVGIRELKQIEGNKYMLVSSAKSFFTTITEHTVFLIEEQKLLPLEYKYKRTGIGKNRKITLSFDWQTQTVRDKDNAWEMELPTGTLDKLLYQFKMRKDLQYAAKMELPWPDMSYRIADGGRMKTYVFKVTGEEEIETPVGKIKTVKTIRIRKSDNRMTTFWLAPKYEFMLIRLQQVEKNGKGFELLLKEAQFNGKQIKGY